MKHISLTRITNLALVTGLMGLHCLSGQEEAASPLQEFIQAGKPVGDFRLRFEHADQAGLMDSDAVTVRSRIGFLSGQVYGFQAFIEMEDVRLLSDSDEVNLAGSNPEGAGHTAIPDPEATELNRAWIAYNMESSVFKAGRARIKLDNDRFIGNVGWRQNEQTFDMVSAKSTVLDDFELFGSYIWKVQRIFGNASGAAADFTGDNIVLNGSYTLSKALKVAAFAYLLELDNAVSGAAFAGSGNTYGVRATGNVPLGEVLSLAYEASYAHQTDNGGSPDSGARSDFDLDYFALNGVFTFSGVSLGGGVEILEGDGTSMFATPLATVHAFQGWADVFLGNSVSGTGLGGGIVDYYLTAGYKIPVGNGLVLKAFYHLLESETAAGYDGDYGTELNFVAVYPINKNLKALAKFASYEGDSAAGNPKAADVDMFWLELNFSF